jgi:hypothetical protein
VLLAETIYADELRQACAIALAMGPAISGSRVGSETIHICLPGEATAAAAARQQLLQQYTVLVEACKTATEATDGSECNRPGSSSSSSSSSSQSAAARQQEALIPSYEVLSAQLQQFGDAVCSQLPFAWWCCNPCCSSLQHVSEQVPVSGRSCLCSRCKTARFCSSECLAQCWKGHHRRVCKRIAAARQG